jgi:UDP-N-acetylmuramoylalanine--D-glutamate ligase
LRDWRDKRVVILGLARQGKALARHLRGRGAEVVVSDIKPAEALAAEREELAPLGVQFALGGHPLSLLDGAEALLLSGGVPTDLPIVQGALERGLPVENEAQLFLEACPAPVIGITGSAGKSTTTALVGRMMEIHLKPERRKAWVGGNIGNPLIGELEKVEPRDWVVMELSSFQLELMTCSPHIAAVLNITPNHLDRHKTMAAYREAKARILEYQLSQDMAVLGRDDPGAWALRDRVRGRLLTFGLQPGAEEGAFIHRQRIWLRMEGAEREVCRLGDIRMPGQHNLLNMAAACALAGAAGAGVEAMRQAILTFTGLPHRLELVAEARGVRWVNDSIATSPERALAAVRAVPGPIILLLGGRDKDLPWDSFGREIAGRVERIILFGEAAEKIERALRAQEDEMELPPMLQAAGLAQAVSLASRLSHPGSTVLLAPGCTSFDEFRDFEERGERFRQLVKEL